MIIIIIIIIIVEVAAFGKWVCFENFDSESQAGRDLV